MSKSTDWQAFSVELAMEAKKNLDAKDDEITTLRQQLEQAQARITALYGALDGLLTCFSAEDAGSECTKGKKIRTAIHVQRLRQQADEAERAGAEQ